MKNWTQTLHVITHIICIGALLHATWAIYKLSDTIVELRRIPIKLPKHNQWEQIK